MTLSLDHQARVNLAALVGSQECKTLAEVKAAWVLMDKLDLSNREKVSIDYQVKLLNGHEVPTWNPERSLPHVEIELNDAESDRIMRILATARIVPGPMRRWLEPVLAQLPTNGVC